MNRQGRVLGIDFGTSVTVAVLRSPDGQIHQLRFDGSSVLPSGVFVAPGALVTGQDGLSRAGSQPDLYIAHPKALMREESLTVGSSQVNPEDLVTAVLRVVWREALRRGGGEEPVRTVLTRPENWGSGRREMLLKAANAAGIVDPELVSEPEAAAAFFADQIPVGAKALIYDLSVISFDVALIERRPTGLAVVGRDRLENTGGESIDIALYEYVGSIVKESHPAGWFRLAEPRSSNDQRMRERLRERVRSAKEALSHVEEVTIAVPLVDLTVSLDRDQLDHLATPVIEPTIAKTRSLVRDANLTVSDLAGVFLIGGASRMPLVASLLSQELRVEPVVVEHPEWVLAEGAVRVPPPPVTPWHRRLILAGAALALIAGLIAVVVLTGGHAELRFGVLLPQTGHLAGDARADRVGMEVAMREINDAGGVLGHKITLSYADEGETKASVRAATQTLLEGDPDVIIGAKASAQTLEVISEITGAGVVEISPSNTADRLTNFADHDLYFRLVPPDAVQGKVLGDTVVHDGHHNLAILARHDDYGLGLAAQVKQSFERGGGVAHQFPYPEATTDFAQLAAQIKVDAPDAIVIVSYSEIEGIAAALSAAGLTSQRAQWYLVDGNLNDHGDITPAMLNGVKGTLPGAALSPDLKVKFDSNGFYDVPSNSFAPEAYDAVVLAALAAAEANSNDSADIARHLHSVSAGGTKCRTFVQCRNLLADGTDIDYDGQSGPIDFTSTGEAGAAVIGVYTFGPDGTTGPGTYIPATG